jgi:hypothetical protein
MGWMFATAGRCGGVGLQRRHCSDGRSRPAGGDVDVTRHGSWAAARTVLVASRAFLTSCMRAVAWSVRVGGDTYTPASFRAGRAARAVRLRAAGRRATSETPDPGPGGERGREGAGWSTSAWHVSRHTCVRRRLQDIVRSGTGGELRRGGPSATWPVAQERKRALVLHTDTARTSGS